MKPGKWARLVFVAAPLLIGFGAGCGDFWQAPSGGGTTCTTNCTTATSGSFYILDAGSSPGIVGASIVTGTLTAITNSPWLIQGTPYSMAIDPAGNFLIVSTTSGVFSFPITNGQLGTAVTVSTDQAYAVQVDATSSWLIEALPSLTSGSVTIGAIPIVTTTGVGNGTEQDVAFTVTNAAVQPNKMVISGDNSNVFVALGAGGTLVVPFNAAVAAGNNPVGTKATPIPVVNASGSALSVAVDPGTSPRLFYIGETEADSAGTSGGLRAFNYSSLSTGTLTQATGSPLTSGGLAPNFILPIASGDYVYVANGQGTSSGNVSGFTITASTASTPVYTLSTDTSTAAGEQPLGLAEDSTATFVFEVGSQGSPYFDAYTFDSTTLGQLDSQITATSAASSIAIVAAP